MAHPIPFERSYSFSGLVIPCLTNVAYGIWDPFKLEWHSSYMVNHDGIYGDVVNLNRQRRKGFQKLIRNEVLNGFTAVIVDQGAPNYYHTLANIIPDILKITSQHQIDNAAVPEPTRILREYFQLLDLKIGLFPLRYNAVPIQNGIIPETYAPLDSSYDQCAALVSVKNAIENKLSFKDFSSPDKVYVERKVSNNGSNLRAVFPREKLHGDLVNNGWHVVCLEDLSVFDQIKLFANAKRIAAVHGAAITNILYASPSANIIEITHVNGSPDCFLRLSKVLGMSDYKQIACKGFFDEHNEQAIKNKCGNFSNNVLPLLYTEELKDALFG